MGVREREDRAGKEIVLLQRGPQKETGFPIPGKRKASLFIYFFPPPLCSQRASLDRFSHLPQGWASWPSPAVLRTGLRCSPGLRLYIPQECSEFSSYRKSETIPPFRLGY